MDSLLPLKVEIDRFFRFIRRSAAGSVTSLSPGTELPVLFSVSSSSGCDGRNAPARAYSRRGDRRFQLWDKDAKPADICRRIPLLLPSLLGVIETKFHPCAERRVRLRTSSTVNKQRGAIS